MAIPAAYARGLTSIEDAETAAGLGHREHAVGEFGFYGVLQPILEPAAIGSGCFHSVPRYHIPALTSRMA
jgi:hypothetical protein